MVTWSLHMGLPEGAPYIVLTYPIHIKGPIRQNPLKEDRDHMKGP